MIPKVDMESGKKYPDLKKFTPHKKYPHFRRYHPHFPDFIYCDPFAFADESTDIHIKDFKLTPHDRGKKRNVVALLQPGV